MHLPHRREIPETLERFIGVLELALGMKAIRNYLPMQPGDVVKTYADVTDLEARFGYRPATPVKEGVKRFADWYLRHVSRQGAV